MKKQTHLPIPPLFFPCPTPFLLNQLPLQLSWPSNPAIASDACGPPSLPHPTQPPAKKAAAMILQDLKRWLCANHFHKLILIKDFIIKYTRFAWAGGTFFLVVLYVVSVFGSGGKKVLVQFWFKYVFTT